MTDRGKTFEGSCLGSATDGFEGLFQVTRLRLGGKPHLHGYFMLDLPVQLLKKCYRIFRCYTWGIMMFYLCSVELDVALVMGVPEDLKLCCERGR